MHQIKFTMYRLVSGRMTVCLHGGKINTSKFKVQKLNSVALNPSQVVRSRRAGLQCTADVGRGRVEEREKEDGMGQ